jgi:hypothetical protein
MTSGGTFQIWQLWRHGQPRLTMTSWLPYLERLSQLSQAIKVSKVRQHYYGQLWHYVGPATLAKYGINIPSSTMADYDISLPHLSNSPWLFHSICPNHLNRCSGNTCSFLGLYLDPYLSRVHTPSQGYGFHPGVTRGYWLNTQIPLFSSFWGILDFMHMEYCSNRLDVRETLFTPSRRASRALFLDFRWGKCWDISQKLQ